MKLASPEVLPIDGFRFAGLAAGIKANGRPDLALAVADAACSAAGLFTTNLVRAAPVTVAEARVLGGRARAVLANSGCANACTGAPGLEATLASTRAVARALGAPDAEVLPASTGVIGALLASSKIEAHAAALVSALSRDGAAAFAEAILTTDRGPKVASLRGEIAGRPFHVLGIAKGAGMIHPAMAPAAPHATMLAFLFTDAAAPPRALARALAIAADATFHTATVDGDTSTNDTLLALASGRAADASRGDDEPATALVDAFTSVSDLLARAIVSDGEGAEHLAEIVVRGLASDADARVVARTVATSSLVKTALFGRDPNWGRLLAAAGRAGVAFDPERARIAIEGIGIVEQGVAVGPDAEARARAILERPSYTVELTLGDGPGRARYLTCDLGLGYVRCNADYRS